MLLDADLRRQVDALAWYHTFDLPGGITTPGIFDHRRIVRRLPLPDDLTGKRCLDVASADGFFAFELARRGGDVTSVDLADTTKQDWQGTEDGGPDRTISTNRARTAFEVVRHATGAEVERIDGSVYDLDPGWLGTFDFIFMGNILLHLQDPARALEAVRSVCRGTLFSFEMVSLSLTLLRPFRPAAQLWHLDEPPQWWTTNVRGHSRLLHAAGWKVERRGRLDFQPFGAGMPAWPDRLPRRFDEAVFWAWTRRVGAPTTWAWCSPAGASTSS